jgi:hypothetical protein
MGQTTHNVFISHIHEDDHKLARLKELLAGQDVELRDSSIHKGKPNSAKDPDYIKSGVLAPQIKWAGTLVVLVSHGTHESPWVEWEIEYAAGEGKRIVGVWDQGAQDADLPEGLRDYASAIVGWNGERIADAIMGTFDGSEMADGRPWPERPIARYTCR